jgi:hypothetical protein
VSVSLSSGQTYYIKVWSPTSSLLAYNLSMSSSGGGGGGHKLVLKGFDVPDGADVFYQNAADDPDNPGHVPHSLGSTSSPTQTSDAALATGTSVGLALPMTAAAEVAPRAMPAAAGAFQDRADSERRLTAVLLDLGQQTPPVLLVATTPPAVVPAGPATGPSSVLLPGPRLPIPRVGSGSGDAAVASDEDPEVAPAGRPAQQAEPSGTPVEPEAGAQDGRRFSQRARDACFADASWGADPMGPGVPSGQTVPPPVSRAEPAGPDADRPGMAAENAGPAPNAATAAAGLAVVLGGYGGVLRVETEPRRQRHFRI